MPTPEEAAQALLAPKEGATPTAQPKWVDSVLAAHKGDFDPSFEPYNKYSALAYPLINAAKGFGSAVSGLFQRPPPEPTDEKDYPAWRLSVDQFKDKQAADAFTVAGGVGTGALPMAQRGAAGIFGGRLAQTADRKALELAESMALNKIPREQIWNESGWFQGPDKKWRFEIPDFKSFVPEEAASLINQGGHTMGDVLKHPALYDAYPQLKGYPVGPENSPFTKGSFHETVAGGPQFRLDASMTRPELRSVALHEGQHGVQGVEDFARGSNPEMALKTPEAEKLLLERAYAASTNGRLNEALYDSVRRNVGNEIYRHHAGEVEARNVQGRADLSHLPTWAQTQMQNAGSLARDTRAPWTTADTPEIQQIINYLAAGK